MSVTTVHGLLRKARRRIEDPSRWTQKVDARAKNGRQVDPREPSACRWCAAGAVMATEAAHDLRTRAWTLLSNAAYDLYVEDAIDVNDLGTRAAAHKRVLAVYDEAIRRAKRARL